MAPSTVILLPGVILLLAFISRARADPPTSVANLNTHVQQTSNTLECYVCNTGLGQTCDRTASIKSCKTEYMKIVYGDVLGASDIKLFPPKVTSGTNRGWGSDQTTTGGTGYQSSSFQDIDTQGGFKTCSVMKVVVPAQSNGGRSFEVDASFPRAIYTCSFSKEVGCKTFKAGVADVTVCNCNDKKGCNSSSNLRVSHWMFAAFLVVLFAQMMRN